MYGSGYCACCGQFCTFTVQIAFFGSVYMVRYRINDTVINMTSLMAQYAGGKIGLFCHLLIFCIVLIGMLVCWTSAVPTNGHDFIYSICECAATTTAARDSLAPSSLMPSSFVLSGCSNNWLRLKLFLDGLTTFSLASAFSTSTSFCCDFQLTLRWLPGFWRFAQRAFTHVFAPPYVTCAMLNQWPKIIMPPSFYSPLQSSAPLCGCSHLHGGDAVHPSVPSMQCLATALGCFLSDSPHEPLNRIFICEHV